MNKINYYHYYYYIKQRTEFSSSLNILSLKHLFTLKVLRIFWCSGTTKDLCDYKTMLRAEHKVSVSRLFNNTF